MKKKSLSGHVLMYSAVQSFKKMNTKPKPSLEYRGGGSLPGSPDLVQYKKNMLRSGHENNLKGGSNKDENL